MRLSRNPTLRKNGAHMVTLDGVAFGLGLNEVTQILTWNIPYLRLPSVSCALHKIPMEEEVQAVMAHAGLSFDPEPPVNNLAEPYEPHGLIYDFSNLSRKKLNNLVKEGIWRYGYLRAYKGAIAEEIDEDGICEYDLEIWCSRYSQAKRVVQRLIPGLTNPPDFDYVKVLFNL